MKIFLKNLIKAIGSRMTYLLVGLSFSVVVIAVNAAIPWNDVPTRNPGQTLSSSDWNSMKNDLDSLRTAVDGISVGGVVVVEYMCYGPSLPGVECAYANGNRYSDVTCPADHPVVVGADCVYRDADGGSYPVLGRPSSGESISANTYRCYFWNDGNGIYKNRTYCAKF